MNPTGMDTSSMSEADADEGAAPVQPVGRRPYQKPALTAYGRVVDMTRSGSRSPGESRGRPKG